LLPVEVGQRPIIVAELGTGDRNGTDGKTEVLRRDLAAIGMTVLTLEDNSSGTA
jgi:hypothetical protein